MNETKGDRWYVRVLASAFDLGGRGDRPCRRAEPHGEIGAGRFPSHVCQKGDSGMMDLTMIGTLGVSFGMVWLLVRWCQKQLDDPEA